MALARTDYAVQQSTVGGTNAFTTGALTIPANSLLVVRVAAVTSTGAPTAPSDNLTLSDSSGLTWTSRLATDTPGGWGHASRIWTAETVAGGSLTFTVDCGADSIEYYFVEITAYTGYDTSTPVGATASGTSTGSGADSITLSAAPAADSDVLAFLSAVSSGSGTPAATPAAGWTEIHDTGVDGWHGVQSQSRTGSTSTTVGWGDVEAGGAMDDATLQAIEVTAAASGAAAFNPAAILKRIIRIFRRFYGRS